MSGNEPKRKKRSKFEIFMDRSSYFAIGVGILFVCSVLLLVIFMFVKHIITSWNSPTEYVSKKTYILNDERLVLQRRFQRHADRWFGHDYAEFNYRVKIYKSTNDKYGLAVWKYDRTVDCGSKKPDLAYKFIKKVKHVD